MYVIKEIELIFITFSKISRKTNFLLLTLVISVMYFTKRHFVNNIPA